MKKATEILCDRTDGIISKATLDAVRETALSKYQCVYAKRKVLNFSKGFLKYLTKTTFDTRYLAFELSLEMPKVLKMRKHVTSRIVTKQDVENLLLAIEHEHSSGQIDGPLHELQSDSAVWCIHRTATASDCSATHDRAVQRSHEAGETCLRGPSEQEKIRMQHYCPLHPQVAEAILPLIEERRHDEPVFGQLSFQQWLRYNEVRLLRSNVRIVNGDLRKFCEQMGDILQWDQSNKNYILTHGVSGVDWRFYKHPLPDSVYDVYMKYWGEERFEI